MPLVVALALWLLYWIAGFPLPNWDDLFFVGGAIELARDGHLANPLIRFWSPVAAERYFFQTPFYPYTLAGWIELFGLSARSLLAFQAVAGATCSISAALLLRRYGFSGGFVLPILVASAMAPQGLRHDLLGLTFLMSGLWLLSHLGVLRPLLGALLLACGVATWPVLLGYGTSFGLAVALAAGRRPGLSTKQHAARRLGICLAGAAGAFLLLIAFIQLRLPDFLTDFTWHARLRRSPLSHLLPELRHQLTNGLAELMFSPLYLMILVLVVLIGIHWRQVRREALVFLVALGAGTVLTVLLYASVLHLLVDLFFWIGVAVLLGEVPLSKGARRLATGGAVCAFLLAQSHLLISLASQRPAPEERYVETRQILSRRPLRRLAIDEVAARHVFDYRLPPRAFSWNYSLPPQKTWPASVSEKSPDVTWVLSSAKSREVQGLPPWGKMKLFGRELGSIPAQPRDVIVIE